MIDLSEQDTIFDRLVRDVSLDEGEGSGEDEQILSPDLGIQPKAPQPDESIDTGVVPKPDENETYPTSTPAITQNTDEKIVSDREKIENDPAVNEDLKSTLGEETEVIEESIDTTAPTSTGSDTNTTSTVQTSTTPSSDNSNSTTVVTTTQAGTTKSADSSAVSFTTLSTLIVMTILSWAL